MNDIWENCQNTCISKYDNITNEPVFHSLIPHPSSNSICNSFPILAHFLKKAILISIYRYGLFKDSGLTQRSIAVQWLKSINTPSKCTEHWKFLIEVKWSQNKSTSDKRLFNHARNNNSFTWQAVSIFPNQYTHSWTQSTNLKRGYSPPVNCKKAKNIAAELQFYALAPCPKFCVPPKIVFERCHGNDKKITLYSILSIENLNASWDCPLNI